MVYKKSAIKKIVKELVKVLSNKIKIEKVILFGSCATKSYNKYSDIDLAVVSSSFKGVDDIDRLKILLSGLKEIKIPYLVNIDLLGFTREELNHPDCFSITGEISQKGKMVYSL
ncbi:MAG: nucleotidyltransferase domain-containing protein [Candidatus Hydrogenedentota bacterium]